MALSLDQISTAKSTIKDLSNFLNDFLTYLNALEYFQKSNWSITENYGVVSSIKTFTPTEISQIQAYYNTLQSRLTTLINQLPASA